MACSRQPRLACSPLLALFVGLTGCGGGSAAIGSAFGGDSNSSNQPPRAVLNSDLFVTNADERRGIPIVFTVFDDEGDRCIPVVQWRRENEPFPALPSAADDILNVIEDPMERRRLQICTELQREFAGSVERSQSPTELVLPELATLAVGPTMTTDLLGSSLRVMRKGTSPVPVELASAPAIEFAIEALPLPAHLRDAFPEAENFSDGTHALLLAANKGGGFQLTLLELVSGQTTQLLAGAGFPVGMSLAPASDASEQKLWLCTLQGSTWTAQRFDLATRTLTGSALTDTFSSSPPRDIAAVSRNTALLTVDRKLMRADVTGSAPRVVELIGNDPVTGLPLLSNPWGIAVDPLLPDVIYLSEPAADRILRVRLQSLQIEPVAALLNPDDTAELCSPLPRPRDIALEKNGGRLLVWTQPRGTCAGFSLRSLDLNSTTDVTGDGRADPYVDEIARLPGSTESKIAAGPQGLRLVTLPGDQPLAIGGGLAEERTVVGFDPARRTVRVASAFQSPPEPGSRWELSRSIAPATCSPAGTTGLFLWDSSDVEGGGRVQVRVTPIDVDRLRVGVSGETSASKLIRSGLLAAIPQTIDVPLAGEFSDGEGGSALGDLDRDGDLDFVVAHGIQDEVVVYLQVGPGRFERLTNQAFPLPAGGQPRCVHVADLNRDGLLDIATANFRANSVSVFLQKGAAGTFRAPIEIAAPETEGVTWVNSGDLDHDGDQDLIIGRFLPGTENPGSFSVLYQVGGAQLFEARGVIVHLPGTSRAGVVSTADMDGDGLLDIVIADQTSSVTPTPGSNVTVYRQEDPEMFTEWVKLFGTDISIDSVRMAAAVDLDRDGDLDLVAANASKPSFGAGNLQISEQLEGNQWRTTELGDIDITLGPRYLAVGDTDNDGDYDLVSSNYFGDSLTPFAQKDRGPADTTIEFEFDPEVQLFDENTNGPQPVHLADLEGDGDLDAVVSNMENRTVTPQGADADFTHQTFLQRSAGQFSVPLSLGSVFTTFGVLDVDSGDWDGDGLQDLFAVAGDGKSVSILRQTSPGRFEIQDPLGSPAILGNPVDAVVADFDGDSDLDVVVADDGAAQLVGFYNDMTPRAPELDGPPDISLFVDEFDPDVRFFEESFRVDLAGKLPTALTMADFDRDGDLDLVSSNEITTTPASYELELFAQDGGTRSFESVSTLPLPTRPGRDLQAVDLDADGFIDLVVATQGVGVFFGQQAAPFLVPGQVGVGAPEDPRAMAIADFDANGLLDIAVTDQATTMELARIFFQESARSFSEPLSITSDVSAFGAGIAASDFDADGDIDFTVAAQAEDALFHFVQVGRGRFVLDPEIDPTEGLFLGLRTNPGKVVARDLDGDGDIDLLVGNEASNNVAVVFGSH